MLQKNSAFAIEYLLLNTTTRSRDTSSRDSKK